MGVALGKGVEVGAGVAVGVEVGVAVADGPGVEVGVEVGAGVGIGVGVGATVAVGIGEAVGGGTGEVVDWMIRTQSSSFALLLPGGEKTRVPLLEKPPPIVIYAALVGSNQRACERPLIAAISTVIEPLWSGGM